MPVGQHPFIDVAVHRQIRSRFARGEALVLFASDLCSVLWANGGGAALFGFATPYELMDEWHAAPALVQRQLGAAASRLGGGVGEKSVSLRIASGLRSRTVSLLLIGLELFDGTPALLLADATPTAELDPQARAARIVTGLGDAGTQVAVLDSTGRYLAVSSGVGGPEIDASLRRGLVESIATGDNRLVKRMIATDRGKVAVALARLSDEPALHLLFAVETGDERMREKAGQPEPAPHAGGVSGAAPATRPAAPTLNAWSLAPDRIRGRGKVDAANEDPPAEAEAGPRPHKAATTPDEAVEAPVRGPAAPGAATVSDFAFDPAGKPVRFVWKIDPEGRFSELSPDFAAAVGPNAADVVDRPFQDVAKVFGFDRDNEIADLLQRRDTWSGKTVSWPVQGTSLSVPVDLAALPIYDRQREFQGFRGFGVVRVADAHPDPEAIGMSLVVRPRAPEREATAMPSPGDARPSTSLPPGETQVAPASPADPGPAEPPPGDVRGSAGAAEDDPFRGETPALRIVKPFGRRQNDKVIDLDERRSRTREVLSSGEQQAFQEIGERLARTFGRSPGEEETRDRSTVPAAEEPDVPPMAAQDEGGPAAAEPAPAPDQEAEEPGPALEKQSTGDTSGDDAAVTGTAEEPGADRPRKESAGGGPQAGRIVSHLPSAFATTSPAPATARLSPDVVDGLPVALLVHDGHVVHHANAEFFELTGYTDLSELAEAGGLGNLFAAPEITDGGMSSGSLPGALPLLRADGGEIPVHARLQSVQWNGKRALMLSLVPAGDAGLPVPAQDNDNSGALRPLGSIAVAPAQEAARVAALKVEVEELRSILETATDGVVILGEHGDVRSMNRSASALFDYDESEIRGQPFAKLFAHESQRAVMDYLNGLSEHGVASVLNDGREVIGREASGGFLPLFMTIGRLTGSNGYCAVMRDITQWKRTEEELRAAKFAAEQANSHKSEFLARVSHEIRTPLNAIIGFSDMMAEERFGPIGSPRYLEYARDIGRSGKHVLDIVNDLLDISKIEAGEMEVSFTAVALNEAIAEAVSLLQPQANSQRVIIRTSLSSSVPEIVADQRSIKQIALNILSNAIRFTPPGGQIVVSTAYEAEGSVALRIRDTGVGMSQSELEQAMKPFRQVKGSSRPRGDGTGLGLPLTKAMVEANRAQFDIRSAPNEGTLIQISFPPQRVLAD